VLSVSPFYFFCRLQHRASISTGDVDATIPGAPTASPSVGRRPSMMMRAVSGITGFGSSKNKGDDVSLDSSVHSQQQQQSSTTNTPGGGLASVSSRKNVAFADAVIAEDVASNRRASRDEDEEDEIDVRGFASADEFGSSDSAERNRRGVSSSGTGSSSVSVARSGGHSPGVDDDNIFSAQKMMAGLLAATGEASLSPSPSPMVSTSERDGSSGSSAKPAKRRSSFGALFSSSKKTEEDGESSKKMSIANEFTRYFYAYVLLFCSVKFVLKTFLNFKLLLEFTLIGQSDACRKSDFRYRRLFKRSLRKELVLQLGAPKENRSFALQTAI
jgi:hypothetical protein